MDKEKQKEAQPKIETELTQKLAPYFGLVQAMISVDVPSQTLTLSLLGDTENEENKEKIKENVEVFIAEAKDIPKLTQITIEIVMTVNQKQETIYEGTFLREKDQEDFSLLETSKEVTVTIIRPIKKRSQYSKLCLDGSIETGRKSSFNLTTGQKIRLSCEKSADLEFFSAFILWCMSGFSELQKSSTKLLSPNKKSFCCFFILKSKAYKLYCIKQDDILFNLSIIRRLYCARFFF